MTKVHICKCGHMKSDHLSIRIKDKYICNAGQCDYLDCNCKKYDFYCINIKVNTVKIMPKSMISSNYESLNLEPYKRTGKGRELLMSNLDINGKPVKYL